MALRIIAAVETAEALYVEIHGKLPAVLQSESKGLQHFREYVRIGTDSAADQAYVKTLGASTWQMSLTATDTSTGPNSTSSTITPASTVVLSAPVAATTYEKLTKNEHAGVRTVQQVAKAMEAYVEELRAQLHNGIYEDSSGRIDLRIPSKPAPSRIRCVAADLKARLRRMMDKKEWEPAFVLREDEYIC